MPVRVLGEGRAAPTLPATRQCACGILGLPVRGVRALLYVCARPAKITSTGYSEDELPFPASYCDPTDAIISRFQDPIGYYQQLARQAAGG